MLLKELFIMKENRILVSIERGSVSDEQLTGFISELNDDFVVMELYNTDGQFDGFTLFATKQITEVLWGNSEHKSIAKLINTAATHSYPKINLTSIDDILLQLNSLYKALGFMEDGDERSFDVGRIIWLEGDWMKLECYGTFETLSKLHKITKLDNYSRIEFGRPYISSIVSLHNESDS